MKRQILALVIAAFACLLLAGCKTNDSGWPVIPFFHNNNPY